MSETAEIVHPYIECTKNMASDQQYYPSVHPLYPRLVHVYSKGRDIEVYPSVNSFFLYYLIGETWIGDDEKVERGKE